MSAFETIFNSPVEWGIVFPALLAFLVFMLVITIAITLTTGNIYESRGSLIISSIFLVSCVVFLIFVPKYRMPRKKRSDIYTSDRKVIRSIIDKKIHTYDNNMSGNLIYFPERRTSDEYDTVTENGGDAPNEAD